jgi:hypothetical protein
MVKTRKVTEPERVKARQHPWPCSDVGTLARGKGKIRFTDCVQDLRTDAFDRFLGTGTSAQTAPVAQILSQTQTLTGQDPSVRRTGVDAALAARDWAERMYATLRRDHRNRL